MGLSTRKSSKVKAAAGTFDPTDISGLYFWYDASDTDTITESSGAVSQWDDKSGNGYDLTAVTGREPTTGSMTLNGLNVIDFDSDALYRTGFSGVSLNYTVFAVAKRDTGLGVDSTLCSFRRSTDDKPIIAQFGLGQYYSGGLDHRNDANNLTRIGTNTNGWDNAVRLVVGWKSGTSMKSWNGGGSTIGSGTATAGATTVNELGVGCIYRNAGTNSYWAGYIAELFLYDSGLDNDDINDLGDYLADKWNLSWSDVS